MEELAEYRQVLIAALEGVLPDLSHVLSALPIDAWHSPMAQSGSTPHYFLSRLLQLESQVFNPQLQRIVAEDTPVLPLFDVEAWMAARYKPDEPAPTLFDRFARLRRQEVEWLRRLPADSWSSTARHPRWGLRTLQWWVELQLQISQEHLAQLSVEA